MKFEATAKPMFVSICHCSICQRFGGGETQTLAGFAGHDSLKVVDGEEHLVGFNSSPGMTRNHCGKCGSPVLNVSLLEDFAFRDAPVVLFERDTNNRVKEFDGLLKPQSHLFYNQRMRDYVDDLDKWEGLPGSSEKLDVDQHGAVLKKQKTTE